MIPNASFDLFSNNFIASYFSNPCLTETVVNLDFKIKFGQARVSIAFFIWGDANMWVHLCKKNRIYTSIKQYMTIAHFFQINTVQNGTAQHIQSQTR